MLGTTLALSREANLEEGAGTFKISAALQKSCGRNQEAKNGDWKIQEQFIDDGALVLWRGIIDSKGLRLVNRIPLALMTRETLSEG